MPNNPGAGGFNRTTSRESRSSFVTEYYVNGKIVDPGGGVRVGTTCFLMDRAVGTGDTVLQHALGRIPNAYKAVRNSSGGVLFDATTGITAWTPLTITLRATIAGTYSIEII